MARVLSLSEAKAHLSQLVVDCESDEEELVITRNGRPAAVLMSADEYEGWRESREIMRNRSLMKEIGKVCGSSKKAGGLRLKRCLASP